MVVTYATAPPNLFFGLLPKEKFPSPHTKMAGYVRACVEVTPGLNSTPLLLFAGYSDVSKSWQMTDYDETDIEPMILRLCERVRPFYQQLHAYVRRRLTQVYRNHALDPHGPIPAHLLGTRFRNILSDFCASSL